MIDKDEFNVQLIMESEMKTVVTNFIPQPKKNTGYQSEEALAAFRTSDVLPNLLGEIRMTFWPERISNIRSASSAVRFVKYSPSTMSPYRNGLSMEASLVHCR